MALMAATPDPDVMKDEHHHYFRPVATMRSYDGLVKLIYNNCMCGERPPSNAAEFNTLAFRFSSGYGNRPSPYYIEEEP